jgi:hypothetical protein
MDIFRVPRFTSIPPVGISPLVSEKLDFSPSTSPDYLLLHPGSWFVIHGPVNISTGNALAGVVSKYKCQKTTRISKGFGKWPIHSATLLDFLSGSTFCCYQTQVCSNPQSRFGLPNLRRARSRWSCAFLRIWTHTVNPFRIHGRQHIGIFGTVLKPAARFHDPKTLTRLQSHRQTSELPAKSCSFDGDVRFGSCPIPKISNILSLPPYKYSPFPKVCPKPPNTRTFGLDHTEGYNQ